MKRIAIDMDEVLADTLGWRSVFIVNVPVAALAALLTVRTIPASVPPAARRRPDVAGAVLITSAVALLVWAPTYGSQHGWASAGLYAAVAASLLLLAVFIAVEARYRDPLIRLSMLRSRWLAGTNLATAVTVMGTAAGLDLIDQLPEVHGIIIDDKDHLLSSKNITTHAYN